MTPRLTGLVHSRRDEILRLAGRYGIRNIRMFGSVVRNEERADSDLDLLVDIDDGRTLLDLIGFSQDVEALLGRKTDVVTTGALKAHLRKLIEAEAVAL